MHPKIEINLFKDWAAFLRGKISELGYVLPSETPDDKTCIYYYEIADRTPEVAKRTVVISDTFTCPPENLAGLAILEEKIRKGEDIGSYLSTRVRNLENFDGLLLDWGIHHLHLGVNDHPRIPGFMERTGSLLYARFTEDTAYFLGVLSHGHWSNQDLVRILHRNWPDSIKSFLLKDVLELSYVPTDEDIGKLRNAQINTSMEIEPGVFYLGMGGGISAAGTSSSSATKLNNSVHFFKAREKQIIETYSEWKSQGVDPSAIFQFTLQIQGGCLFAYSAAQNFRIRIK